MPWGVKIEPVSQIPETLGGYRILGELGRGGMAVVYRAHQDSVGRDVAIKVITSGLLGREQDSVERFQREARLIARLEHPHVLPVYDYDGRHDPPYLVLRYLEGGTLASRLAPGTLSLPTALACLAQVASAVDYAHRQGIIHRDIKPSNILLDGEGHAFLADLGLARLASVPAPQRLTQPGTILGTVDYMAPEQALAPDSVGTPADVYALGAVAFHLLTGHPPYVGSTVMAVVMQHQHAPIPSARAFAPTLAEGVDRVFARVLAKDPAARHATASELVQDLYHASGLSVSTRASELIGPAPSAVGAPASADTLVEPAGATAQAGRLVTTVALDLTLRALAIEARSGLERVAAELEGAMRAMDGLARETGGELVGRAGCQALWAWGLERAGSRDAEAALAAALELSRRLGPTPARPGVGLFTGALLVETHVAGGRRASGAGLGIALRLAAASSGDPVVSPETARRLRTRWELRPEASLAMGAVHEAFTVVGERTVRPARLVATELVGRGPELARLDDAWLEAADERGCVVRRVVAPAGAGKTRLVEAWRDRLVARGEPVVLLAGRGVGSRPYALLRDVLARRISAGDGEASADPRAALVDGWVALAGEGERVGAAIVGQLAGYDFAHVPEVRAALDVAHGLAERAVPALEALLSAMGARAPVLVILDDLHDADAESIALFDAARLRVRVPLLVVELARPPTADGRATRVVAGVTDARTIPLGPLSRREVRLLVARLLDRAGEVPARLADWVADRAEGSPYFAEELACALVEERVVVPAPGSWSIALDRLDRLELPAGLADLVRARFDAGLPAERAVLQVASVFEQGITWDLALVDLVAADVARGDVDRAIAALVAVGDLVRRERAAFAGTVELVVASSTLREVADRSMLASERARAHARAADWLERTAGARAPERAAALARHREAAGDRVGAARWRVEAAARPGVLTEQALADYDRALELLVADAAETMRGSIATDATCVVSGVSSVGAAHGAPDESNEADRLRARAHGGRGAILGMRGAYEGARASLELALGLARAQADRASEGAALAHLARVDRRQGRYEAARARMVEALELAERLGDPALVVWMWRELGVIERNLGIAGARLRVEKSLALARERGLEVACGDALNTLGNFHRIAGELEAALPYFLDAARSARATGDRDGLCLALANASAVHYHGGRRDEARALAREGLECARAIGNTYAQIGLVANIARCDLADGRLDLAGVGLAGALAMARAAGDAHHLLEVVVLVADHRIRAGELDGGRTLLATALADPVLGPETRREALAIAARIGGVDGVAPAGSLGEVVEALLA